MKQRAGWPSAAFRSPNTPAVLAGVVVAALSAADIAGWLFERRFLVQLSHNSGAMVLSSAAGCLLAAMSLLVGGLVRRPLAVRVQVVLGLCVIALGSLAGVENLFHINLGLDFPRLHAPVVRDYLPAGRMAISTAAGLFLLGLATIAVSARRPLRLLLPARVVLTLILMIALLGIIAKWLNLQDIFSWFENVGLSRMSLLTSLCMLLLGLGQWSLWSETIGEAWTDERVEAMRISHTAALMLAITAVTTGVTGLAILQSRLMEMMTQGLAQVGRDRLSSLEQTLVQRTDRAALLSNQEFLVSTLRDFSRTETAADAAVLRQSAEALLKHGFRGVVFRSSSGHAVSAGSMIEQPEISLPVKAMYPAKLLWSQGYFLETSVPVGDARGVYGYVISQQHLYALDRITAESNHWGRTGEMEICGLEDGGGLHCFPQRTRPSPFHLQATQGSPELPIRRALRGESNSTVTRDLDGRRVLATFGPVGSTGLAVAIKMETAEILEPIRRRLEVATPLLGLLVLAGVGLMQRRVRPLIRKLVASQDYIRHLATHDGLTGLPNRMLLEDRLEMAIRHAERHGQNVALIMVDLDHFKPINDTLGHAAGDQLLQQVAYRLRNVLRASDTAARFGGDEFLALLPSTQHPEGTTAVAKKILDSLNQPVQLDSCTVSVTASVGIACYPEDGADMRALLRHADTAMYAAKYSGRNTYRHYESHMGEQVRFSRSSTELAR